MSKKTLALLAFGTIFFVFYLARIPWNEAIPRLASFPRGPLLLLVASNALTPVIKAIRWRFLLGAAGKHIPFRTMISGVSGGFFLGLVTPGTSGELARVVTLKVDRTLGISSIIFEKIWDFIILLLIALTAILALRIRGPELFLIAPAVWLLAGVGVYVISRRPAVASTLPRLLVRRFLSQERGDKLAAVWASFVTFLRSPRLTFVSAFFAFLLWVIPGCQYYFVLHNLGVDASFRDLLISFFVPYLVGVVSLVPLGLGVFDLSASHLSQEMFDISPADATASVLLYRMLIPFVLVLWGFYCYVHRVRKKERTKEADVLGTGTAGG